MFKNGKENITYTYTHTQANSKKIRKHDNSVANNGKSRARGKNNVNTHN